MIKELYQQTVKETSLNIVQGRIDAVMKKKITKSGCRVYQDGFIGVAGTLGQAGPATWVEAESGLAKKISYPFTPEKGRRRQRDLRELEITEDLFISEAEDLLQNLRREHPDFIFSNKIKLLETEIRLQNDAGLDYLNCDRSLEIALLIKHIDSLSIFDTYLSGQSRDFDKNKILGQAGEMLRAFQVEAVLPKKEKIPIIIHPAGLLSKVNESLNGEAVGLGTSLFANKIGLKAFSEIFSVIQDRTDEQYHTAFFDMEGVVNPDDKVSLIENGVILKPYTDKRQAAAFSFTATGAASGSYDGVPSLGSANLTVVPGTRTLKELLGGEPGILVIMASGGDYTGEGNFATPVQMSYLTDGEQLLGKLPELNISGNLYEIFGPDFIGVSADKPLMGERALVARLRINPA